MAKDLILLGEVAARGATTLEIRCRRCDRHGRLSVARLLAQFGPEAAMRDIMQAQVGACPNRSNAQLQNRCNPYCPDLVRLFGAGGAWPAG
jgi:hypothetical protein